ncbi:MAG: hypothetical protein DMG06_29125, partial [Acidobacteria bacterium]
MLLEEGKAVAGYVDIDRDMEIGLRRANGAFRSHLNDAVLPPEAYLVRAHDGSLRGVISGGRAAEFGLARDRPKLLVQHRGTAAGAVEHRNYVGDLVIENLLDRGQPTTRGHQSAEVEWWA